jgi:hypothetical protein
MKFTFKKKDKQGEAAINFSTESLEEVVAEFEKFLIASGFDLGGMKFALIDLKQMEVDFENELEEYFAGLGSEADDDGDEGEGSDNGNGGRGGNQNH